MGVINFFIGGSGKFVAEEVQGLRRFYNLSVPPSLVFDVNTQATHTGSGSLGHGLHAPHGSWAVSTQNELGPKWKNLRDPADGLLPDPSQGPGPSSRPETQIMRTIGSQVVDGQKLDLGLWGFRPPGLLGFAAFLRPDAPADEMDLQQRFKKSVSSALQQAGANAAPVTINIIASTAGGTGAGFFLPFALWLKQHPDVNDPTINLLLVTPSAFDNLSLSGAPQVEMSTKARSGTFAILKELELFDHPDDGQFPIGKFPIDTGMGHSHLAYRLKSGLFSRTYWLGRRALDNVASNIDTYGETEKLIRILGDETAAGDLDSVTGGEYRHRLLPSVVTIDYPAQALARKHGSRIAHDAIVYLRQGEKPPPVDGRRFFEYPGDDASNFGLFLQTNRSKLFSPANAGRGTADPRDLQGLVTSVVVENEVDEDYAAIPRGARLRSGGYGADAAGWDEYCVELFERLDTTRRRVNDRLETSIQRSLRDETTRFKNLVVRVARDFLDPQDDASIFPLSGLRAQATGVGEDLAMVSTFFGAGFTAALPNVLVGNNRFATKQQLSTKIKQQQGRLRNPPRPFEPAGLSLRRWGMLGAVVLGMVLAIYTVANRDLTPIWKTFPTSTEGLNWALPLGLAMAVLMFLLLRRGKAKLHELRRKEERTLVRVYRDAAHAHVAQELFPAVGEHFVPSAETALDNLDHRMEELDAVYAELLSRAEARASLSNRESPQSVGMVGENAVVPTTATQELVDGLLASIQVKVFDTQDAVIRDLGIELESPDGEQEDKRFDVEGMAEAIRTAMAEAETIGANTPGGLSLEDLDSEIDEMSTGQCAAYLPRSFEQAVEFDGGADVLYPHLAMLMHRTPTGETAPWADRRKPSIDTTAAAPLLTRLYVPSTTVGGLVQTACNSGVLAGAVVADLQEAMQPHGQPNVVPALGTSIALLSMYEAPVASRHPQLTSTLMGTEEGQKAYNNYYGLVADASSSSAAALSQRYENFHILPEAAAAAAIELALDEVRMLQPCVAARLLGSHPVVNGPTILELFYMLRAMDLIERQQPHVTDQEQNETWCLKETTGRDQQTLPQVPLLRSPMAMGAGPTDNFGAGRGVVSAFDAFKDFLLYDGSPLGAIGGVDDNLFAQPPIGEVLSRDWGKMSSDELIAWQREIVVLWRDVDQEEFSVDDLKNRMDQVLHDDVVLMDKANAANDWNDAVAYLIDTGYEKRRKWSQLQ